MCGFLYFIRLQEILKLCWGAPHITKSAQWWYCRDSAHKSSMALHCIYQGGRLGAHFLKLDIGCLQARMLRGLIENYVKHNYALGAAAFFCPGASRCQQLMGLWAPDSSFDEISKPPNWLIFFGCLQKLLAYSNLYCREHLTPAKISRTCEWVLFRCNESLAKYGR